MIALAATAVALALYLWDPEPVQRLELGTVDARFSVRGAQDPDSRLVLIAVDDKTLARLDPGGTGRLPREWYARLLDRLREDRPAVIALDVLFAGAREPRGDRALREAIRASHERLVLPFEDFAIATVFQASELEKNLLRGISYPASKAELVSTAESNGATQETMSALQALDRKEFKNSSELDGALLSAPLRTVRAELLGQPQALEATGVRTGFAGLPDDVDERNRRTDYQVNTTAEVGAHTFAFAAADVVRGGALDVEELPSAPRRRVGEQSENTTWIDFLGPAGAVPSVSALDVLEGRVAPGEFRDKRVVIGVTAPGVDVHRTPFERMPGGEVQASALDTILRSAPATRRAAAAGHPGHRAARRRTRARDAGSTSLARPRRRRGDRRRVPRPRADSL